MNLICEYFLFPTSPVLIPMLVGCLLIALECFPTLELKTIKITLARLGILGSLGAVILLARSGLASSSTAAYFGNIAWLSEFSQSYRLDQMTLALYAGLGLFTLLSTIYFEYGLAKPRIRGETLALLLFIFSGMMLLVSSDNLLITFLALELLSLPTYVLVGINRKERLSAEAALKYFLFGSFASVLFVFGAALLFAQFGTLRLPAMGQLLLTSGGAMGGLDKAFTFGGVALLTVATAFKMGAVPFHMWVPDVYQGAPTAVTGFMGSAIKMAAFGLGLRILWGAFLPIHAEWGPILGWVAVITMFVGNIAAVVQDNLKRMFAYSSVAHAGYLLLGLAAVPKMGPNFAPMYYYLVVYGLMFIGLLGALSLIEKSTGGTEIHQISGVGFSRPFLGFCIAVFALSGAGIPPTAGFMAKYFIFLEAVRAGRTEWVVLGVISSLIGAYYYLRILVFLYMKESKERIPMDWTNKRILAYVGVSMIFLFFFTIMPGTLGIGGLLR